ncbi:hypothetical protein OPT61_g3235 [Boeremia exigua]|uniref:Uncharacterized protein n=1 Tax=Boeremia exigua TaxID=749465 RepID=A0ACC2IIQ5_9PLEO|nr:hypothetical protein OPT61_g3235 [Boeremia exigua]
MINESLPPDVQAARRSRMNSDIVKLCIRPRDPRTRSFAQGIGLYTHVAGSKASPNPPHLKFAEKANRKIELLPLGGPKRVQRSKFREARDKDLDAVYTELQNAVNAEEKNWSGQNDDELDEGEVSSLDALREKYGKYGDANAPAPATVARQQDGKEGDTQRVSAAKSDSNSEATKQKRVSFAPQSEPRRQGTGSGVMPHNTPGSDRRGTAAANNNYHIDRDPRRLGR